MERIIHSFSFRVSTSLVFISLAFVNITPLLISCLRLFMIGLQLWNAEAAVIVCVWISLRPLTVYLTVDCCWNYEPWVYLAIYLIGLIVFLPHNFRELLLMVTIPSGFPLPLESLKAPFSDHYYLFYILMMFGVLLNIVLLKFLLMTSPFIPRCPVFMIALSYKMICQMYFIGLSSCSLNWILKSVRLLTSAISAPLLILIIVLDLIQSSGPRKLSILVLLLTLSLNGVIIVSVWSVRLLNVWIVCVMLSLAVHSKQKLMFIRHLFDPTSKMLVQCGLLILLMILICWRQYKIGLLAG